MVVLFHVLTRIQSTEANLLEEKCQLVLDNAIKEWFQQHIDVDKSFCHAITRHPCRCPYQALLKMPMLF